MCIELNIQSKDRNLILPT